MIIFACVIQFIAYFLNLALHFFMLSQQVVVLSNSTGAVLQCFVCFDKLLQDSFLLVVLFSFVSDFRQNLSLLRIYIATYFWHHIVIVVVQW